MHKNRPVRVARSNSPKFNEKDSAKDAHALRLRANGWSYPDIAEDMGITASAVYARIRRRMSLAFVEGEQLAATLREEAGIRLDMLMKTWLPRATSAEHPDPTAAAIVLKIIERQARLYGLDEQPDLQVMVDNRTIQVTSETLADLARRALDAKEVIDG